MDYERDIHSPVSSQGGWYNAVVVWANKKCYDYRDQMSFRATLTNSTDRDFNIRLDNEPVFDLIVKIGPKVIKWTDGRPLTYDLTHLQMKPGASKSIEMEMVAPDVNDSGYVWAPFHLYSSDNLPGFPNIPFQVGICLPGFIGY